MPITKRNKLSSDDASGTAREYSGVISYGQRTKLKGFRGTISVRAVTDEAGAIEIVGNSILENYNQESGRYYDRSGSPLSLTIKVSSDDLQLLEETFGLTARQMHNTQLQTQLRRCEELEQQNEELQNVIEALKKAFKET